MKKLFTKFLLLAIAMLMGGVNSANAETKNFTIDLSKFDNGLTYDAENKTASITIGKSKAWSKLDLKEYLDQVDGNITNINITLTENLGTGGRISLGLYDYNKTNWATEAYQDANNSVSVWGLVGNNITRIYYNATNTYTTGVTLGEDVVISVDMNFTTKKFTLKQNGTTKVNGQNFVDTNIDLIRWLALYSWSENTSVIKSMTMEVTYTAVERTVTFNETNSKEYSLVVKDAFGNKIDSETDGSYKLIQGKTYTYTATPTNTMEYGIISKSLTVTSETSNIPFTFVAISLPEYSLPAKALYSKATVPTGNKQTIGIERAAYTSTGVGGPTNNSWTWTVGKYFTWYATFDIYRADESASVNMKFYTNKGAESTSFQFDNQGVRYWTGRDATTLTSTALTPGKWYRIEISCVLSSTLTTNTGSTNTMNVKIIDIESDNTIATKSGISFRNGNAQWFLPTKDQVTNTILTNWYSYYIADEYTKTLGTTGFGTFSAACNVAVPAGVVVYNSTLNGETLTATPSEEISVIPANTGVIFKGEAGANVTFTATADAASTVSTALTAAPNGVDGDGSTIFGLLKNEKTFAKVMPGVSLAENSAYLSTAASGKGSINFVIDDDATAADAVEAAQEEIVSVKKFMKNGQLLIETANGLVNAAGAQVK